MTGYHLLYNFNQYHILLEIGGVVKGGYSP